MRTAQVLIAAVVVGAAPLGFGLSAAIGGGSAATGTTPVRLGCPPPGERVGVGLTSFDEDVAAAREVLYREVTHYQGQRVRRTAVNTPVAAVVMGLGALTPPRIEGQRALLTRAARLCGRRVATYSAAVLFDETLSPVCCNPPITLFVVRTDRSLRVYR